MTQGGHCGDFLAMAQRSQDKDPSPTAPATATLPAPWLALALVVAGLVLAVVLTQNYYRHLLAGQVSGCTISAYVDCDRVSESQFASVAGVPISALAVAVYGALGVLLALPRLAPFRRLASVNLDIATALTGLTTLVALVLAVVAAVVIRALCLYCTLLQVVTTALFILLVWRWRRLHAAAGSASRGGRRQTRGAGAALGSTALALAVGGVVAATATLGLEANALTVASRESSTRPGALAQLSPYLTRSTFGFATDDAPGVGPADAPVQLVVFGDYNCSHCRDFDPEALRLVEEFAGDVRVVFKFFPLDATCNRYMGPQQISSSCVAAAAAYAAHRQDRFLEYHLLLFEHFQNHAPERLMANAAEAGIPDQEAFVTDVQSEGALKHLRRDIDEAAQSGVQATPTVFVNGRRLETSRFPAGASLYQVLVNEIRTLLRAAL